MSEPGIHIEHMPELENPILIAGFDGWGNALDVAKAMAGFLIRKLGARHFAKVDPDLFYRYDETRPLARIEEGILKAVNPPGGSLYAVHGGPIGGRDMIILRAHEPALRWGHFVNDLLTLCENLGVGMIITLGSMYDNVLHTDRIVSGIASSDDLLSRLKQEGVIPINYFGPSGIHSSIHAEATRRGVSCISLWCHCPYYLQGATHYGLLRQLGGLLSTIASFPLEMDELESGWKELHRQIQKLVEKNPELQNMIQELRKAKWKGSWGNMRDPSKRGDKIIRMDDFLKPH